MQAGGGPAAAAADCSPEGLQGPDGQAAERSQSVQPAVHQARGGAGRCPRGLPRHPPQGQRVHDAGKREVDGADCRLPKQARRSIRHPTLRSQDVMVPVPDDNSQNDGFDIGCR